MRWDGLPGLLPDSCRLDGAGGSSLEMEEARRVQQCLLPREAPRLGGWDVATAYRPARLLSGDFCDLFEAKPGQIAVALGDVCGKGLGPALIVAGLRALVRSRLAGRATNLASHENSEKFSRFPSPGPIGGAARRAMRYCVFFHSLSFSPDRLGTLPYPLRSGIAKGDDSAA
jgi:hypothetical protein